MDTLTQEIDTTLASYAPAGTAMLKAVDPHSGVPHLTRVPNPDFVQPPVVFAEKFGLAGIAAQYRLPENISAQKLETYVNVLKHAEITGGISPRMRHDRLFEIWQSLIGRNPQLAEVRVDHDKPEALQTAIIGVTSAYLPRDIAHFMSLPADKLAGACKDKSYETLYKKVCAHLGSEHPRWVPHLDTLKEMDRQFTGQKLQARANCLDCD